MDTGYTPGLIHLGYHSIGITMQVYDIIMLVVLAATTLIGFRKGLAWQVASVAAIVVSYFVAVQFRHVVAEQINTQPPWNTFLAMLILYVATSFVIWVAFQLVRGFIDRAKLTGFDQQMGALFGLAKGVLLCVIITLFAVTVLGTNMTQQIIQSRSGFYIAQLLDRADQVMPAEVHEFLHPFLSRLEQAGEGHSNDPGSWAGGGEPDEINQIQDWLEGAQGLPSGDDWTSGANSLTEWASGLGFGDPSESPSDELGDRSFSSDGTLPAEDWSDDPFYRDPASYRAQEDSRQRRYQAFER